MDRGPRHLPCLSVHAELPATHRQLSRSLAGADARRESFRAAGGAFRYAVSLLASLNVDSWRRRRYIPAFLSIREMVFREEERIGIERLAVVSIAAALCPALFGLADACKESLERLSFARRVCLVTICACASLGIREGISPRSRGRSRAFSFRPARQRPADVERPSDRFPTPSGLSECRGGKEEGRGLRNLNNARRSYRVARGTETSRVVWPPATPGEDAPVQGLVEVFDSAAHRLSQGNVRGARLAAIAEERVQPVPWVARVVRTPRWENSRKSPAVVEQVADAGRRERGRP